MTDREAIRVLRDLTSPHVPDAIQALVDAVKNPRHRQRIRAARALLDVYMISAGGADNIPQEKGVTKILLVDRSEMSRIVEAQRQALRATAQVVEQK